MTGTTKYTADDLPFGQYKQTLGKLPDAIQSKLAEKYQATGVDTLLFEAEARDGDIYTVISGDTTVTIIAFNSGGTPIGYATLAE